MGPPHSEEQAQNQLASEADGRPAAAGVRRASRRSFIWLPLATLAIGLAVTGTLALLSHAQYTRNEKRLLKLRVGDAAALLAVAVPGVQTPLASAAELADATGGDVQKFKRFIASYVGTSQGKQFASVSLWRLAAPQRGPVAVVGIAPALGRSAAAAFFAQVVKRPELNVIGMLQSPTPRIGYAYATPGLHTGFVAYGETLLPANRRSRLQSTNQFAGLDYAIYLGAGERTQNLLVSSVAHPPLTGNTAAETIPFGTSAFTLAMSSRASLAGALPQALPWIIAIAGALLALAGAGVTFRLAQRRRDAERLATRLELTATENQQLYAEQRSIAQTLQHALLPDRLPQFPGVETSARYEAGEHGVDIGGDWYDVIDLEDGRLLLVVGDVSGRGLRAATTMALLRYAIHAYAAQQDDPAEILTKLSKLVSVADSGQLATILCALVDVGRRQISVTSAGHLPPLLLRNGDGHFVESDIGLPIGVDAGASYTSTTISAPPESTFVAFTDGLVEHRGEDLDQSLARLRQAATGRHGPLSELLRTLVTELQSGPAVDDIAIVGLRWTS
jgi:serine phosphatase RsbU (regulator of sigma subunit)